MLQRFGPRRVRASFGRAGWDEEAKWRGGCIGFLQDRFPQLGDLYRFDRFLSHVGLRSSKTLAPTSIMVALMYEEQNKGGWQIFGSCADNYEQTGSC